MIYIYNNKEIKNQFNTDDDTSYPANWLELSTEEDKINLGIITLVEVYPELNYNEAYDGYEDDYINLARTYKIKIIFEIEEPE